ncbi:MAG: DNA-processing protein DprA [Bacteroidaceae bacterium]|nr:DNA-processing protein DprA [Bacteroidaceae bacterium]
MQDEQIYTLALSRIPGLGLTGAYNLIRVMGSAGEIFRNRKRLPELVPGISDKLVKALDCPEAFKRAEEELQFAEKNSIACLTINDEQYPSRLRECEDAPLALFYRGNTNLNVLRIVSIVGTRHSTAYGQDLCQRFIADLSELSPDILIVSGLAYGIDIHAHRYALQYRLPTIGVLAHGLDRIYPSVHRQTAIEMMNNGGLLTEFMSKTNPDRQNFVKRNRIVAGMSDAVIVVESAIKGGALITAELAESYHRDCFTFPGRVNDVYSAGCNALIKNNRASLILSAEDFVNAMNWNTNPSHKTQSPQAIQKELFPQLSEEEKLIVRIMKESSSDLQINTLVVKANIPIQRMSALLFELEMKGLVKAMAGGVYRLL